MTHRQFDSKSYTQLYQSCAKIRFVYNIKRKKIHFKETVFIYIYILTTADDGLKPIAHQEPKPVIFGTTLHI